jgi:hypothetical protein
VDRIDRCHGERLIGVDVQAYQFTNARSAGAQRPASCGRSACSALDF